MYLAANSGFDASGSITVVCPVSVDTVGHANPSWDMTIVRFGAGTVSCTGRILDANGATVATSSDSDSGTGTRVLSGTFTAPVSSSYAYAFNCTLPNATSSIPTIGVF